MTGEPFCASPVFCMPGESLIVPLTPVKVHLPRLLNQIRLHGRACLLVDRRGVEMAGLFSVLFWAVIVAVLPCVYMQNVSFNV